MIENLNRGFKYTLDARYIREDWVLVMVIAAFALGLIIGAVVNELWNDRPKKAPAQPRRTAERPPVPPRATARHRAPVKASTEPLERTGRIDVRV